MGQQASNEQSQESRPQDPQLGSGEPHAQPDPGSPHAQPDPGYHHAQPDPGQQPYAGQQPYPGQSTPQQYPSWYPQQYPSQQPYPGQPYPGQPYPGQQYFPPPQPPSPKPGVIPLRPLGLGEILDGAITAIRSYPKLMLGVSALASAVSNLLSVGVVLLMINQTDLLSPDLPLSATDFDVFVAQMQVALLIGLPASVVSVMVGTFLTGMLTVVMGKAVLGQPITFGEAWQHIKPRFGALLGLSLLYMLIVVVGSIFLILPGVWLYVLFSLASTALVLEGATVGRSFDRSRALINGAWWRTFGILILAAIMVALLSQIVELPFGLVSGTFTNDIDLGGLNQVLLLSALGAVIAETITLPFTAGVTTLIYIDRRMRREGMDIELARQAGVPMQPQQPPTAW